jgi:outer membrane biosynthesis protein TonB
MAIESFTDQTSEELILTPRGGDRLIRINISRNTLIALIFSVLIHALILFLVVPKMETSPPESASTTIEVSLAPAKQAEPAPPQPQVEQVMPEKPPEPVKKPKTPKVMTQQPKPDVPTSTFKVPDIIASPKPSPEVEPPKETEFPDMQSYIKAQQAKRQSSEFDAVKQNAEAIAKETGPSEEEIRDQRIAKNLKGGAGGTFTLTSLSGRHATFSFNGWVNSLSNQKQQYFEVEAKSGQDVRVLMIKQVISFIRESYQGDFPWDSKRLGKVITLSARPEDNSSLEEFLMTEFFGSNYRNS